ncbi:MAG: hypothetical protein HYS17_06745 [Micavibrio aeruginosavorus]|uniref:GP-PDE domain-containing protein n=1 Tax=Micavibrio aeruginosavorus TaxID=349221 RepID=A0A7T5R0G4_9BACT|nr:MAG: hypothetical protein HYS17_06745 [Micavibrio aeruginosavorus]
MQPYSLAAFEQAAVARPDFIEAQIRDTAAGSLVCASDPAVRVLTEGALKKRGILRLDEVLEWSKGRIPLVLDVVSGRLGAAARVLNIVARHNMQDQVVLAAHSVRQTREISRKDEKITVLGVLAKPEEYGAFYEAGGHIARLWEGNLTPGNLRLAEDGVAARRKPVWAMAGFYPNEKIRKYGEADLRDLFSMMSKGVKGVIVNDAALAREALRQRQAPQPACGSFAID